MRNLYFVHRDAASGQWLVYRGGSEVALASFYTRKEAREKCREMNVAERQARDDQQQSREEMI